MNGTVGRATWPLPNGLLASGEPRLAAIDHTCSANGVLSPSITSRLPPLIIQASEALELGYMPQRDDFERVNLDSLSSIFLTEKFGQMEDFIFLNTYKSVT